MSQSPHYPNNQNLPPAHERRVWPPEDVSGDMLSRMIYTPYRTGKSKMTKKARLRRRAYHHVLARRLDGRVEVVMGDCIQGKRWNNVLPRRFRKARSEWVKYATHERFQNATYERRLAPWGGGHDSDDIRNESSGKNTPCTFVCPREGRVAQRCDECSKAMVRNRLEGVCE